MTWGQPMQLATGPACPKCGCEDARILQQPRTTPNGSATWWGSGVAVCRHCGNQFVFREAAERPDSVMHRDPAVDHAVPYVTTRCPHCRSTNVVVTKSVRPIRHHKCRDCGRTFKSVENDG